MPPDQARGNSRHNRTPLASIAVRFVVLAVLWWALTEGRGFYHWPLGLAVIGVATWTSLALKVGGRRRRLLSLRGLIMFVPLFLKQSLFGGIDVARRAFHPTRQVQPAWGTMHLRLADEPSRVFLAAVVSLMPGTLSVELEPRHLRIHVLDESMIHRDTWRDIERHVAALFHDPGC